MQLFRRANLFLGIFFILIPASAEISAGAGVQNLGQTTRSHWAFQPVNDSPVPAVKNQRWLKTPIDNLFLRSWRNKTFRQLRLQTDKL